MILGALGAMLIVLFGFAALAVDVANGYVVRGMLQHAVDDGARTAQRWSAQVDDPGVNPAAVQAQAAAEAIAAAQRDLRAQGLDGTAAVNGALTGSLLRLEARARVGTWFLRVFGVGSWSPAAASEVALWMPASAAPLTSAGGPSEGADRSAGATDAAVEPGPDTGAAGAAGSGGAGGGDIAEGW